MGEEDGVAVGGEEGEGRGEDPRELGEGDAAAALAVALAPVLAERGREPSCVGAPAV